MTTDGVPALPIRLRRPGGDRPGTFRRLHLVHRPTVRRHVRDALPAAEQDAEDVMRVVRVPLAGTAALHLYPYVRLAEGASWPVRDAV